MTQFDVVVTPEPFTPRVERLVCREGTSIIQLLTEAVRQELINFEDLERTEVYVNGRMLIRDLALEYQPKPGEMVNIAVMVHGGGGGRKIMQLVLTIAVIALSFWVGGPAGPLAALGHSAGAMFLRAAAAAAIATVGTTVTNLLFGPKPPAAGAETYSLSGSSNQARPRAPMPLVLGKQRIDLDLISSAYTSQEGDDSYLHVIFGIHYGKCNVTDIKLGETAILDLTRPTDVDWEIFTDPGPRVFNLYPMRVVQENYGDEMDHDHAEWETHTTAVDCEKIENDFVIPVLYFKQDDDADLFIDVEYSAAGENTWAAATGFTIDGAPAPTQDRHDNPIPDGQWFLTGKTHILQRHTMQWTPPSKGQWDMRMRRNIRPDPDKSNDAITWSAMRTIENRVPVLDETLACMSMRIKATANVNGTPPTVTAVVEPICPIWNGTDWDTEAGTSNAAALLRYCLSGPPAGGSATDTDTLLNRLLTADQFHSSLNDAYDLIETNSWQGGLYVRDAMTQEQLMVSLGMMGRFESYWNGSQLCFVPDWERAVPRQLFTGKNAAGYRYHRMWQSPVHALIVEYRNTNRDDLNNQDQLIVYNDGYDETNSNELETLTLDYACTPERAYKEGRVWLARRKLMVETHEWQSAADGIVSTFGDRVLVRHNSSLFGQQDAYIQFRHWVGGLVTGVRLTSPVQMNGGSQYAMDVRKADRVITGLSVVTAPGGPGGLQPVRDVYFPDPLAPDDAPEKGDLIAFGKVDVITEDLQVIDHDPQDDMTVKFTAVRYLAVELMAAETGTIPDLQSLLTPMSAEPIPKIDHANGDDTGAHVYFTIDSQRKHIVRGFAARWRLTPGPQNENPTWTSLPSLPATARRVDTGPIPYSQTEDLTKIIKVDVEIRTITGNGVSRPGLAAGIKIQPTLPVPENLVATGFTKTLNDGTEHAWVKVSCDAVDTGPISDLIVEYKLHTDDDTMWESLGHHLKAANPSGKFNNVENGVNYDIRAQWRATGNWRSDWTVLENVLIPPDVTPPAMPTLPANPLRQKRQEIVGLWINPTTADLLDANIYRASTAVFPGGTPYIEGIKNSKFSDKEVSIGETWHYWVTARDRSKNESAPVYMGNKLVIDKNDVIGPSPVAYVTPSQEYYLDAGKIPATRLLVDWPANTTDPDFKYYEVAYSKSLGPIQIKNTRSTHFEIDQAKIGVLYTITVTCYDTNDNPSTPVTVTFTPTADTVGPGILLSTPTALAAVAHKKGIVATWTPPADTDLAKVQIIRNTSFTTVGATKVYVADPDETKWTDTDITVGQQYWYWGRGVDIFGNPCPSGYTFIGTDTAIASVDMATVGDILNSSLGNLDPTASTKLGTIATGADVTASNFSKGLAIDTSSPSTNDLPSVYRALGVHTIHQLKGNNAIGSPGPSTINGILETKTPSASTSDQIVQVFDSADGRYKRKGAVGDGSWGAWKKVFDQDNKPDLIAGDLANASLANLDVTAANNLLTAYGVVIDAASDNVIARSEKKEFIRRINELTSEQFSLDAQAIAQGITTEKTNYDSAVSLLISYLASCTTPVLWSDKSDKTNITSSTLNGYLNSVASTKTALISKLTGDASTKAAWLNVTGTTGAVGTIHLAGGAVTPSKMGHVISDQKCLDPYFEDFAGYWGITGGSPSTVSGTTDTAAMNVPTAIYFNSAVASTRFMIVEANAGATPAYYIPAEASTNYEVSFISRVLTGFNGWVRVQINFYTAAKANCSPIANLSVGDTVYNSGSAAGSNINNSVTGQITTPADCAYIQILLLCDWSSNIGASAHGSAFVSNFHMATRKVRTIRSPTMPTGTNFTLDDTWIDTSQSPKVHNAWNGTTWDPIGINAQGKLATMDPKTIFDINTISGSYTAYPVIGGGTTWYRVATATTTTITLDTSTATQGDQIRIIVAASATSVLVNSVSCSPNKEYVYSYRTGTGWVLYETIQCDSPNLNSLIGVPAASGTHVNVHLITNTPGAISYQTLSGNIEDTASKGAASGYCGLDGSALVPTANLPTIPIANIPALTYAKVSGLVGTGASTLAAGNDSRIAGAYSASGGTITGNVTITGNMNISGFIKPTVDNSQSIGTSSLRMATVYSAGGVVTTSDRGHKMNFAPFDDELLDAVGEVGFLIYQLRDAVVLKGEEGARWHAGSISQALAEALLKRNLNPDDYAFWCRDLLFDDINLSENLMVQVPRLGPDGKQAVLYSLRYDQLLSVYSMYLNREIRRCVDVYNQLKEELDKEKSARLDLEARVAKIERQLA